jgi:hypothetical protein
MSEVCSPNSVNLFNDCILWCELPPAFMDSYKASGSDSFDGYFLRQLKETGMNTSQLGLFSAMEESAAPMKGHPPSVVTFGILFLTVFVALSI